MKKSRKLNYAVAGLPMVVLSAIGGVTAVLLVNRTNASAEGVSVGITGDGTKENPYAVDCVEDLQALAKNVGEGNDYQGKYIVLTADVDFMDGDGIIADMQAIGNKQTQFKGNFDGGGHTVSNLYITDYTAEDYFTGDYVGLFGFTSEATIKNLTVKNPFIVGSSYVGGIVGCAYTGTVENCHVVGEIDIEGYYMVGGVTGHGYAQIKNCSVIGDEDWAYSVIVGAYKESDLEGDNVGGIVGHNAENGTVSSCTVKNIAISGTRKVGGIAGTAFENNRIVACAVENSSVVTNATEEYAREKSNSMGVGGIIGLTSGGYTGGKIEECVVKNVTLGSEKNLTDGISLGAITGGHRGSGTVPDAPKQTAYQNNITLNVVGATSNYLNTYVKVGEEEFSSLAEAIAYAEGAQITLVNHTALGEEIRVEDGESVTLDLSGYTVKFQTTVAGVAMFTNYGDFTLSDSVGGGKIVFTYAGEADSSYGKGNYTISNSGSLTVNGGTVENATKEMSHAFYTVDNNSINKSATLTVNGGKILNANNYAVRAIANKKNAVWVKGGEIVGTRAVWVQLPGSDSAVAPEVLLNVEGGVLTGSKIDSTDNLLAVYSYSYGNSMKNVAINISGGEFNGDVALTGGKNKTDIESVTVTGGTFNGRWGDLYTYGDEEKGAQAITVKGGTFTDSYVKTYCGKDESFTSADSALAVKAQTNTAGNAIRFVGAVDSLAYAEVGFEITFNGKTVTRSLTQVFTSLRANDEAFTAETAFGVAGYLFAFTVTEIPEVYQDTAFTVRAYRKTENGAVIFGEYNQLKISDGLSK